jgi:hypothetical protein
LVRFDGLAALISGCSTLLLRSWIAGWTGIPLEVLGVMATVALGYAVYSLQLSTQAVITALRLRILACANTFWALVCIAVTVAQWSSLTRLGVGYLLFEAAFVGALAWYEFSRLPSIRR